MITQARAALPRRFWYLVALFVIFNGFFGFMLFLKPGTNEQFALYPEHANQRDTLLQAADQAMYVAKQRGRNKVCLPHEAATLPLLTEHAVEHGRATAALEGVVKSLTFLLETHDPSTNEHSQNVGKLVKALALSLNLKESEAQMLQLAGQLHDIGKIVIPQNILQKPGKLTESEQEMMRAHPVIGSNVLSNIPMLRPLATIVRGHHERWDGQGYPDKLAGQAIPIGARLIAVADTYMVLTSSRAYKVPFSPDIALQELQRHAGTQFDPEMVESLTHFIESGPSISNALV